MKNRTDEYNTADYQKKEYQKKDYRKEVGRIGEGLAELMLLQRGYKIIKNNYNCKWGEIDIIAKKDGTLAFVEVKTRLGDSYGMGRSAVDRRKLRHMKTSAEYFLQRTTITYEEIDFQVIEISAEHLENLRI